MGFKELEGIHSRTDFDLKQHEQFSGKKLQFFDPELNQSYVPYVVETSVGLDRMFLSVLSAAYQNEQLEDGSERVVLKIPAVLAENFNLSDTVARQSITNMGSRLGPINSPMIRESTLICIAEVCLSRKICETF
jgi:hypothetical protein